MPGRLFVREYDMSGNARGQLKEEMEGIVRNLIWIQKHSESALDIIQETHPELVEMFKGIHGMSGTFAENLQGVYAKL
jgi:hypothetical protein